MVKRSTSGHVIRIQGKTVALGASDRVLIDRRSHRRRPLLPLQILLVLDMLHDFAQVSPELG